MRPSVYRSFSTLTVRCAAHNLLETNWATNVAAIDLRPTSASPNMSRLSVFRRSLLVIWIPPILGMFLAWRLFAVMAMATNFGAAWEFVFGFTFAAAAAPSLIWWAVMESVWRWGGARLRNVWTAIGGGTILGGTLAALAEFVMSRPRDSWPVFIAYSLPGCVCGGLLGALVFPRSRRTRLQSDTSETAPAGIGMLGAIVIAVGSVIGSAAVLAGFFACLRLYQSHLPSDVTARQAFAAHRDAYAKLVDLIGSDPTAHYINPDGEVNSQTPMHPGRVVPEYRRLLKEINAQAVLVREDGTIEFEIWGSGGAIMSDSYEGIRYAPEPLKRGVPGYAPIAVASLEDEKLPHDKGGIVSGLYIMPIERNWSIYRFEYRE
jgi:predicted membrane protein